MVRTGIVSLGTRDFLTLVPHLCTTFSAGGPKRPVKKVLHVAVQQKGCTAKYFSPGSCIPVELFRHRLIGMT